MSKQKFKTMKVFDCQDMPDDVRRAFFDHYRDWGPGNDSYVNWTIKTDTDPSKEEIMIDTWLIANGANDAPSEEDEGETVLISHWW